eukprot:1086320-Ditylum_brightwellii.AAC.1
MQCTLSAYHYLPFPSYFYLLNCLAALRNVRNKCLFKLNSTFPDNTHRKDLYTPFDIHLDPADANSFTISHSVRKLDTNNVEHVLIFIQSFDGIIAKANIPEGGQHWTLFKSLLLNLPKTKWTNRAANVALHNQANFAATIELWLTNFMSVNISDDILERLRNLMKPKDMSVSNFAAKLDHFNELV